MSDPFIRITGLKKHYQMGGQVVRALDGVDLEMEAKKYAFRVEAEEIIPDNLDSITKLIAFIKRKTASLNS